MPWCAGMVGQGADAYADHFQVVLVGVQAAEVLGERLAEAVIGVGAGWHVGADVLAGGVQAGDVVAAGQHDPLGVLAAGGLEEVVGAEDVDVEGAVEAVLVGDAGQMDDPIDVGGRLDDGGQVAEVGADELFALLGGSQGRWRPGR